MRKYYDEITKIAGNVVSVAASDIGYDELIAQAVKIENLDHLPRVPFHEMDDYFQKAKIFINTSRAEGFPNTFIQAAKCGAPILSLNVNPDSFLSQYECGLCAEGDWTRFTRWMESLCTPQMGKEYSRNARCYVEEHHDVKAIVKQYQIFFSKLR